jgi:excisionase family DNA binding protein
VGHLVETRTELLTVKETARELRLAEGTLRQRIARHQIGIVRLHRSVRIPRSEIDRLIERGFVPAAPERK